MLLTTKKPDGSPDFAEIRRRLKRPMLTLVQAHRQFSEAAQLGGLRSYVENGVTVTVCPPAYAHGVWPQRVAGGQGG